MANVIEKILKLIVDNKDAVQGLDKVNDKTKDASDNTTKLNQEIDDTGKVAKKSSGGVKLLSVSLNAVGTALKALGIGLVLAAVTALTEAISRNKRAMDAIQTVVLTVSNVFSQIVDALIDTYDAVSKSTDNFDALGKVMGSLLTLVITPLKLSFLGIKLAIQTAQLAWENSFFGDKDPDVMNELIKGIKETDQAIKDTAKDAVTAGKDIAENFGEAVGEIVNIGKVAKDNLSEVSIKVANENAKAYKNATDQAIVAQAQANKLSAEYERQAEVQRQVRDDARNSLSDREKANNLLLEILRKQETAQLKAADAAIQSATLELQRNDSAENQAALIDAQAAKLQVVADIEGKISEQKQNQSTISQEQKDLEESITRSLNERNIDQLEFEADREDDPFKKIEKLEKALEEEREIIEEDIERKRELYEEDTQLRVDAEEEYLDKKQELAQREVELEEEKNKAIEESKEKSDKRKEKRLDDRASVEEDSINRALDGLRAFEDESKEIAAASIIAENAVAISRQIQSLITANGAAVAAFPLTLGQPFVGINSVSAVLGIAATAKATADALKALGKGGGGGGTPNLPTGGGGGGARTPQANFNIVGQSSTNQLAESINGRNETVRAYVVSGEVTSQQSLDRNRLNNATFL